MIDADDQARLLEKLQSGAWRRRVQHRTDGGRQTRTSRRLARWRAGAPGRCAMVEIEDGDGTTSYRSRLELTSARFVTPAEVAGFMHAVLGDPHQS